MSRIPPWCTIGLIATKTPVVCSQFLGRFFSFLSRFFHVFRTTFCFRALLPYLLLIMVWFKVSLAFIMASHLLWILVSCGHSPSGLSLLTLLHLRFHIKWALSKTRIRYIQLTSLRVLLSWFFKSMRPHPAMLPMFRSSGHNSCFFSHSRFLFLHTKKKADRLSQLGQVSHTPKRAVSGCS